MSGILWEALIVFSFILAGGVVYVIDDKLGAFVYALGYNLFHREPLPAGTKKGFIVGKPTSRRLLPALLVAIVAYKLFGCYYATVAIGKAFVFILAFIGALAGFWVGPWFSRLFGKKDKMLKMVDDIETGKLDVIQETKDAATEFVHHATDAVSGAVSSATGSISSTFKGAFNEATKHLPGHEEVKEAAEEPKLEQEAPVESAATDEHQISPEEQKEKEMADARASVRKYAQG